MGKAFGFKGCGKSSFKRTFGLCDSCLYDWYTTTESGRIEFAKRKIKVEKTNWKEKKAVLKNNVKKLSDYEAEAKKSFQHWVRLRDSELGCISCGTEKGKWHGSHFFSANLYSGLIFDERNVHKSCDYCNVFLHGNLLEYRKGLINRYGFEYVNQLEVDADIKRNWKYSKSDLIEIKKKYDSLIKTTNNEG